MHNDRSGSLRLRCTDRSSRSTGTGQDQGGFIALPTHFNDQDSVVPKLCDQLHESYPVRTQERLT